jgi:REP element-mobilizing transposase RayT
MPACTDLTYHVVFGTRGAIPALCKNRREDLFRYVWGVVETRGSHLYRIGGVDDHIHLLIGLNPTLALADLVTEIQTTSSIWIRRWHVFPKFTSWQNGYLAFSAAAGERPKLSRHIEHQEHLHSRTDFVSELRHLVKSARQRWDNSYLP